MIVGRMPPFLNIFSLISHRSFSEPDVLTLSFAFHHAIAGRARYRNSKFVYVSTQRFCINRQWIFVPQYKVSIFPVLMLPTLSSTRKILAGLRVTNFHASSSLMPPYFTAFAASWFSLRAISGSSELYGKQSIRLCSWSLRCKELASYTSYLYAHQSLNEEAPWTPCFFILSATLYPSRICVNVLILKPMSRPCISILISLCT